MPYGYCENIIGHRTLQLGDTRLLCFGGQHATEKTSIGSVFQIIIDIKENGQIKCYADPLPNIQLPRCSFAIEYDEKRKLVYCIGGCYMYLKNKVNSDNDKY